MRVRRTQNERSPIPVIPLPESVGEWEMFVYLIQRLLLPRLEREGASLFTPSPLPLPSGANAALIEGMLPSPWRSPYPVLCYVVAGKCQMILEGKWLEVPAGYGAFVPSGVSRATHAALQGRIVPCDVLWFRVMPFGVIVNRCQLSSKEHRRSVNYTCVNPFLWDLVQWWQEARSPNAKKAILLTFFWGLLEAFVIPSSLSEIGHEMDNRSLPLPVRRATRWLWNTFDKPLRLTQLAQYCGFSVAYLCRLFRRYLHTTPAGYLRWVRLQVARQLAQQTTLSANDIAFFVGYRNLAAFLRAFRQAFGCSPEQLRDRAYHPRAPFIPKP